MLYQDNDQNKSTIHLPLNEYYFTFQAQEEINLPQYSHTVWHSILGKALFEQSCPLTQEACSTCHMQADCHYVHLFKALPPKNTTMMTKYQTIPSPHVIRSANPGQSRITKGLDFSVSIILIGNTNEYVEALIRAMKTAGNTGIGTATGKAELLSVAEKKPGELEQLIDFNGQQNKYHNKGYIYPLKKCPEQIMLRFGTPYKASGKASHDKKMNSAHLLMSIIRRISLLQYFYTGQQLQTDFKYLKELTQTVPIVFSSFNKMKHQRYSAHKSQLKDTSGWTGCCIIDLQQHQALWPFLYYGQWCNTGKNASMGFGQYKISIVK